MTCTNGRFLTLATGKVLTVVVAPLFLLRYFFKIHNKNVIKTNKERTMKKEIGGIHGMSFIPVNTNGPRNSGFEGQNRKLLQLDFTGFPRSRTKKNPGLTWDRSVIPPLRGGDVTASVQKRVLLQVGAESQWICPGLWTNS